MPAKSIRLRRALSIAVVAVVASAPALSQVSKADPLARSIDAYRSELANLAALHHSAATPEERRRLEQLVEQTSQRALAALSALRVDDPRIRGWIADLAGGAELSRMVGLGGTGTISGTVTAESTGQPLPNAQMVLFGPSTTYTSANALGEFSVEVEAGTWRVATELDDPWINEAWPDLPCSNTCSIEGDAITVTNGAVVSGIDLEVVQASTVTGFVRDDQGQPIRWATIQVYGGGLPYESATTDAAGYYELRVLPGTSRVLADAAGFRRELWPDTPCAPACPGDGGTPIAIPEGQIVSGIDFELLPFGSLTGTVVRESDGTPIAMAWISASGAGGGQSASTQDDGTFVLTSLPDGDYSIVALVPGLQSILYPDVPCQVPCNIWSCQTEGGTQVSIQSGQETNLAIEIPALALLQGTITERDSGKPIAGAVVGTYEQVEDYACGVGAGGESGPDGTWEAEARAGVVTLRTWGTNAYLGQVYSGVDCWGTSCGVVAGDPIAVSLSTTIEGLDFTLQSAGHLSGEVFEKASAAPPAHDGSLAVALVSSDGAKASASVQPDGSWSRAGLPPGNWYARISWYGLGLTHNYRFMVWPDAQCPFDAACPNELGEPIVLAAGEMRDDIDFAIERMGRIQGVHSLADATLPFVGPADIQIFAANGIQLQGGSVPPDDSWYFQRLVPGTYFVRALSYALASERWNDVACPMPPAPCDPLAGTPIVIGVDPPPTPISIALDARPGFRGSVVSDASGEPLPWARVAARQGTDPDIEVYTNLSGGFYLPAPPGEWRLRVEAVAGHQDQAWPATPCPPQPADCGSTGSLLTVNDVPAGTQVDFRLGLTGFLFASGFEAGDLLDWSGSAP